MEMLWLNSRGHLKRARYRWERGRPRPHTVLSTILSVDMLFALCAHCGRGRPRSQL